MISQKIHYVISIVFGRLWQLTWFSTLNTYHNDHHIYKSGSSRLKKFMQAWAAWQWRQWQYWACHRLVQLIWGNWQTASHVNLCAGKYDCCSEQLIAWWNRHHLYFIFLCTYSTQRQCCCYQWMVISQFFHCLQLSYRLWYKGIVNGGFLYKTAVSKLSTYHKFDDETVNYIRQWDQQINAIGLLRQLLTCIVDTILYMYLHQVRSCENLNQLHQIFSLGKFLQQFLQRNTMLTRSWLLEFCLFVTHPSVYPSHACFDKTKGLAAYIWTHAHERAILLFSYANMVRRQFPFHPKFAP